MKYYYDRSYTPLKYHKFVHYVSLPILCIFCFAQLVLLFSGMEALDLWNAVDILYYATQVALSIVVFVGFFSFTKYSWYCMMTITAISPLYQLLLFGLCLAYRPEMAFADGSSFVSTLIADLLIGIYYLKRKPLFFREAGWDSESFPHYCQNCGAAILRGSRYCARCGAEVARPSGNPGPQ